MSSIILNDFQGANYREENLPKNVSPNMLNVDTSRGLVAKRKGYSSLFDSLGAYPTRGVVSHLDEMLYFEGNGSIYRASGDATENDSPESVTTSSGIVTDASYFGHSVPLMGKNGNSLALTDLHAFTFSQDGTKLFVGTRGYYSLRSYTLSTAFDLSTATYNSDQVSLQTLTSDSFECLYGLYLTPDGTKVFACGADDSWPANPMIAEFTMSTAYDLSTATYTDSQPYYYDLGFVDEYELQDMMFSSDGLNLILHTSSSNTGTDQDTVIHTYDIATAFSIDSADISNHKEKSFGSFTYVSSGAVWMSDDGTRVLATSMENDTPDSSNGEERDRVSIAELHLSTAYDVSTAGSTADVVMLLDEDVEQPGAIAFDSTGRRMFLSAPGFTAEDGYVYAYEQDLDAYDAPEYAVIPYRQRENFLVNEEYWSNYVSKVDGSTRPWSVTYKDSSLELYQDVESGYSTNVSQTLISSRNVDLTYVDSIEVSIDISKDSGYYEYMSSGYVYINGVQEASLSGVNTANSYTIDTTGYSGMCVISFRAGVSYGTDEREMHFTTTFSDFYLNYSGGLSGESVILEYDLTAAPIFAKALFDVIDAGSSIALSYEESSDGTTYSDYQGFAYGENTIPEERYIKIKYDIAYDSSVEVLSPMLAGSSDPRVSYSLAYTPSSIASGYTGKLRGVGAGNYVYMTAGGRPFKDDGTTKTDLGLEAPTTAPTLAGGVAGEPSGTYTGLVTFVNADGVESNRSPISSELNVSSKSIDWTIPTGPSDVVSRRLYRTVSGGSVYYLITEIEDNTTTSYNDDYGDTEIQNSEYIAPDAGMNNVPPDATLVWEHGSHMFYVSADDQRRLYFSKVYGADPDAPYAAYEQVPTNYYYEFSYPITGLRTFAGYLIVTGHYFTSLINGTIFGGTSDNTTIRQLDNLGAETHEGMAVAEGSTGKMLALFTRHGISYLTTGQYETDLSRAPLSYPISPKLQGGDLDDSFLFYFRDFLYAGFTRGTGERVVYRFDFYHKTWDGPWDVNVFSMAEFHRGIVAGGMETVQVYTMFEGSADDGAAINMLYDTRFSGQGENITIGKIFVYANNDTEPESLEFSIQGDSDIKSFNIGSNWSEPNASLIGSQKEKMRALGHLRVQGDRFGIRLRDLSTNPITLKKIVLYY